MKEKLILVTDFGSLRAGMIVVVKGCGWCSGATHRGLVVRHLPPHEVSRPSGVVDVCDAWEVLPRPAAHRLRWVITGRTISHRLVYRVIDGLEAPAETRKLEVTR